MRKHNSAIFFRVLALLVVFCLYLSGCVAQRSVVSGSSLIIADFPRLSMTANDPLVLQGYGRQRVSLPSNVLGLFPNGYMDYAVYGEGTEGPIIRHSHIMAVRPSDTARWRFKPESFIPFGGLSIGHKKVNGYVWAVQILRVNDASDWFSTMWRQNGRETPEFWLARRFSVTPERSTRIVAEYREPWPECLEPTTKDLLLVRSECLKEFIERSDAALSLDIRVPAAAMPFVVPTLLAKPAFLPEMRKLVGELREEKPPLQR